MFYRGIFNFHPTRPTDLAGFANSILQARRRCDVMAWGCLNYLPRQPAAAVLFYNVIRSVVSLKKTRDMSASLAKGYAVTRTGLTAELNIETS